MNQRVTTPIGVQSAGLTTAKSDAERMQGCQRSLWTHASELRSGTKSQNEFSVGGQEKGLTDAPGERIK